MSDKAPKPIGFYPTGGSHGLGSNIDISPPVKVGSGLDIASPPAVAIPINGMTLNKALKDKQMTGIGGGRRPYVFSEVKRTATRGGVSAKHTERGQDDERGRTDRWSSASRGRNEATELPGNGLHDPRIAAAGARPRHRRRIANAIVRGRARTWGANDFSFQAGAIGSGWRNIRNQGVRANASITEQRINSRASGATINGRPKAYSARVRAIAGISRRSHPHPVARQVAAGLPGWAALQGAGQQHGRAVHGVDRQARCRAARGQGALPLGMQRDRSGLSRMGTAGLGACGFCRGGEVSERGLGASLAAGAELGGYDEP